MHWPPIRALRRRNWLRSGQAPGMQPEPGHIESLDLDTTERDIEQDGVGSLRDVEAEANDEQGLRDRSIVDLVEADALGVSLDPRSGDEPDLD
mgnify:CR=1 FL=1